MSEDSSPPPATPTPAGNQNLIIGLILGAGVLLLFILVLNMKNGGFPTGGGSTSELETLRDELDSRRGLVNEERRRLGLPPLGADPSAQSVEALAARISNDSTDLVTMVRQLQTLLSEKEEFIKNTDTRFEALTTQNTTQRDQLDQLRGSAQDAESLRTRLATAQSLYESAQTRIADLQEQIADLQEQLATTPSTAEVTTLRQKLETCLTERDQLQTEVVTSREDVKSLRTDNNDLNYEIQKLRSALDRTRLFFDSADKLPAKAGALYARLTECETLSGQELSAEYAKINQELNARVVDSIDFQTDVSRINLDKAQETRLAVQASGGKSYFLIVGYASKTGDFDSNRTLSADRAGTIASVVDFNKKSGQEVGAVFLGQTARFSPDSELKNQICEIWEIKE